jgi:hypothetical protein
MTEQVGVERIPRLPRPEDIPLGGGLEGGDSALAFTIAKWIDRDPDEPDEGKSSFANFV